MLAATVYANKFNHCVFPDSELILTQTFFIFAHASNRLWKDYFGMISRKLVSAALEAENLDVIYVVMS